MRWFVVLTLAALVLSCSECSPAPVKDAVEPDRDRTPATAGTPGVSQLPHQRIENSFEPQVAGGFYTEDPTELKRQVRGFLSGAAAEAIPEDRDIVGILTPHAGYRYSGPVAGEAYNAVKGRGYRTVVVLALCHRRSALKASVLNRPAYDTPLGSARIDQRAVAALLTHHGDLFESNEVLFQGEHSLEVQLPFIQEALPKAKIVPVIVAVHDEKAIEGIAEALYEVLGKREEVLFVLSSDLSHFYPYAEASAYDRKVLALLEQWKIDEWKKIAPTRKGMCGYSPILTFVKMFEKFDKAGRRGTRLAYNNSGDTAGDKSRVVGYGAVAFSVRRGMRTTEQETDFGPFDVEQRRYLMSLAKRAVEAAARGEDYNPMQPESDLLRDQGAAFVTLKKDGQLRGCIGHVIARIPLFKCVSDVARAAAIHDSRFSPVRPGELDDLTFEISVLTAPEKTTPEKVVVGRDGLIMSRDGRSGLLLPQVPVEWNWTREEFLDHTCRKAGLPAGCWKDPDTEIKSFRAIVWGEDDLD